MQTKMQVLKLIARDAGRGPRRMIEKEPEVLKRSEPRIDSAFHRRFLTRVFIRTAARIWLTAE